MSNVIVDLKKIESNTKKIISKFNNYKYYIAVVKTNAYGLGFEIVPSLIAGGVNYLAVSYIDEALKIREIDKNIPILCLQPIDALDIDKAISNNITITISSLNYLKSIYSTINKKIKVHIKIDSGMNRLGVSSKEELNNVVNLINDNNNINFEGLYTHFATVGYIDKHYDESLAKFKEIVSDIDLSIIPIIHFGGSAALIAHNKISFVNGFRSGILFMGYNISLFENKNGFKNKLRLLRNNIIKKCNNISNTNKNIDLKLESPLSFYTKIIEIKKVKKGEFIGYGASYKASSDIVVAILPIGKANGISNNINRFVFINNKKYYMIGNISMNMMIIKVDNSVKIGDDVEVIGPHISLGLHSNFNNESLADSLIGLSFNNKIYK